MTPKTTLKLAPQNMGYVNISWACFVIRILKKHQTRLDGFDDKILRSIRGV